MEQYDIEYLSLKRVTEIHLAELKEAVNKVVESCLLYTSDAADEL